MSQRKLIIAGWSTRAAAQSARRAGFSVTAIDVFQDVDLLSAADECRPLRSLQGLADVAKDIPPSDWLYTGGVENHPARVTAMGTRHRLLGNDAAVLRRIRDPRLLQRVLADGPAPMPETRWTVPDRGDGRRWLSKRRSSGGGVRVLPYAPVLPLPRGAYLQEFVSGASIGASYLAADGRCRFLGLCRQTQAAVDPARPFLYGGSLGPIAVEPKTALALVELGERLVAEFPLRGLFGVDLMLAPDGSLRTLEVNPRYTASMELLERAGGRSLVELHAQACLEGRLSADPLLSKTMHGKRIAYVDDAVPAVIRQSLSEALVVMAQEGDEPRIADIPAAGTQARIGEPLCTLFAAGTTEREVERGLDAQSQRLRELLQSETHSIGVSASSRSAPRRRRAANSGS